MMERYSEYKDSGVDWIGEIPKDWEVKRIKYIAKLYNGNSLNDTEKAIYSIDLKEKSIPYIATKDIEKETSSVTYDNGLYIPKSNSKYLIAPSYSTLLCIEGGSAGKKLCFLDRDVCFVNKLCCFDSNLNKKYTYYFVKSRIFENQFNVDLQGMIGGVTVGKIKNFMIVVPPLFVQNSITQYLDNKIQQIDTAISQQQKMIDLLNERKQIIINQAVTKGVNPNVEMKDSGIGAIPKHWEYIPIIALFNWKSDKGHPNYPVLSVYREYGVIPKDSRDDNHNATSLDTSTYKAIDVGDFVINKMKAWQGSMGVSEYKGIVSPAYITCSFKRNDVNRKYIHHLLRSKKYIEQYNRISVGIRVGQWDMNFDEFKRILVTIPPLNEQNEIVNYIDNNLSNIDCIISKKQRFISLLQERKQIIINDVVLGKVKVS